MKDIFRRILSWEPEYRARLDRRLLADSETGIRPNPIELGYLRLRHHALQWTVRSGIWLPNAFRVLIGLTLQRGDTFVDVGANVGWMVEMGSALVGPKGRVIGYEPSPSTMRRLRHRIECLRLDNVTLVQAAVGELPGTLTLYEYAENYGGASSLRPGGWIGHQHVEETPVSVMPLDESMVNHGITSIRLIKIDVQGAEIDVLRGARRLLTGRHPPVLFVELERDACFAFGHTPDDLIAELALIGYRLFSWRNDGLVEVLGSDQLPEDGHDDAICLKIPQHECEYERLTHLAARRNSWIARWILGGARSDQIATTR